MYGTNTEISITHTTGKKYNKQKNYKRKPRSSGKFSKNSPVIRQSRETEKVMVRMVFSWQARSIVVERAFIL